MNQEFKHCLYIIDGHSLLYKAFFAIRGLSTRSGIPTNGVYGFAQMLLRVIRESKPVYLCVTFDSKAPTFRQDLYPEYKANREVMPDDLQMQIPYVYKMLDALKIKYLTMDGYEADDIIATLVSHAETKGWETRVVTADKDLFQIVSTQTHILRFGKNEIEEFDPPAVKEKMGVGPEQIADLLGLTGDTSDNIPGVPGIGPVTATKLLKDFGTLENIINHAPRIENQKWREKIMNNMENARLSRQLATVKKDIPFNLDIQSLTYTIQITPEVKALFEELEFRTLLSSLGETKKEESDRARKTYYRILRTAEELKAYIYEASRSEILAIDTETTSSDPFRCQLVGVSMSFKPGEAVYIPIGHRESVAGGNQISLKEMVRILSPVLKSPDVKKCGHNIKYDIHVLRKVGLEIENIFFDTMLSSYLLNPDKTSHGLKTLVPEELDIPMRPITSLLGAGKNSITMDMVPVQDAGDYACLDADATLQLMYHNDPKLKAEKLDHLFSALEIPLIPVLAEMERSGIAIDAAYFKNLSLQTKMELEKLESECYEIVGHPFNLNSPRQVSSILFEEIKLTPMKKGKMGYSTDVTVLQALSKVHSLPMKLLEYRKYEKLLTTYIDVLPRQINPETGRIHTSYIQTGTATGRLSSRDPNLQNIPVRTPQGREIRAGFVPGYKDWFLLSADYSQIELRILAHLSGDETLIKAFQKGEDIHELTAIKIFGCIKDFITSEMRDAAKTINFGVIYGMSAHRLANDLDIPRTSAKKFIDDYFKTYSGVKSWIDHTIEEAREKGYVTTLLGRKRYVPDLRSSNKNIRAAAERIAVNTPIQGTSADMIKKAMIRIHHRLKKEGLSSKLLIQVHDELIFEVPDKEIEILKPLVTEEMEGALPLRVPVKVGIKIGANWAEC